MTSKQIKKKALEYGPWEPWMKRPFFAFMVSLFANGQTKKHFKKIGVHGLEYPCSVFYNGAWYGSQKAHEQTEAALEEYLKNHHISRITDSLKNYHLKNKVAIQRLVKDKKMNPSVKLKKIYNIMKPIVSYIWVTHALEHLMVKKLHLEVPKYIKGDIDKFIGEASFPDKKVAHNYLEDALRAGRNPSEIATEFGWIRARDGFARPFSAREILEMKKRLKKPHKPQVKIPPPLKKLFSNAKELVYLRTQRTDVFYELLFSARPILKQAAKKYHIPFAQLKHYTIQSLIAGRPKRYPKNFSWINYLDHSAFYMRDLFPRENLKKIDLVKGLPAQKGRIRGYAKIIFSAIDISKVKAGDVLIAPTTAPSYIAAMRLAAAFVTDEGGITSHAAIIAREMKKPCVIGTKIATKVFKDGDLVEVDANRGMVKKL